MEGRWRPQLSFYNHRTTLLQRLADQGLLLRFRMPDDRVQALVEGVGSLDVGPGHIRLEVGSPVYDSDVLRSSLTAALEPFAACDSHWLIRCCFVIPTHGGYDEARRAAVRQWLRHPIHEGAQDVAVLVDGYDDVLESEYQYEFGVITASEAEARLKGTAGRAAGELAVSAVEVEVAGMPAMATFLDWNWRMARPETKDMAETALTTHESVLARSSERSDIVHEMYAPTSDRVESPLRENN